MSITAVSAVAGAWEIATSSDQAAAVGHVGLLCIEANRRAVAEDFAMRDPHRDTTTDGDHHGRQRDVATL